MLHDHSVRQMRAKVKANRREARQAGHERGLSERGGEAIFLEPMPIKSCFIQEVPSKHRHISPFSRSSEHA
jgi:hypothetical protein